VDLAAAICGDWVSEVHQSARGPMTFQVRIGPERLEVTGTPARGSSAEVFRRSGKYHLDGSLLVTPALNEGRPVSVAVRGGRLAVTIDASLSLVLRRD
jgi:hypothetical protein